MMDVRPIRCGDGRARFSRHFLVLLALSTGCGCLARGGLGRLVCLGATHGVSPSNAREAQGSWRDEKGSRAQLISIRRAVKDGCRLGDKKGSKLGWMSRPLGGRSMLPTALLYSWTTTRHWITGGHLPESSSPTGRRGACWLPAAAQPWLHFAFSERNPWGSIRGSTGDDSMLVLGPIFRWLRQRCLADLDPPSPQCCPGEVVRWTRVLALEFARGEADGHFAPYCWKS